MKKPTLTFGYTMLGESGHCYGVSAKQALDNAKVRYLFQHGIRVTHPRFHVEKAKLSGCPIKLCLCKHHIDRYIELRRWAKDGDATAAEIDEMKNLGSALNDERVSQ